MPNEEKKEKGREFIAEFLKRNEGFSADDEQSLRDYTYVSVEKKSSKK